MDFIGSNAYYILCGIALIILILALIALHSANHRTHKSTSQPQPSTESHTPKYAAGDEMDRINRSAYIYTGKKKHPAISILLGILILLAIILYPKSKTTIIQPSPEKQLPTPSMTNSIKTHIEASPTDTQGKEPTIEIKSTDYSQDLSKIFITLDIANQNDINFYSLTITLKLKDENDNDLQSEAMEKIDTLKPGEEKEITTAIAIEPENLGKIRKVGFAGNFQYYK